MTAAGTEIHSIDDSEIRQSRRRFEVFAEFNIRDGAGSEFALVADRLYSSMLQTRGGAVWQLVGLITRRSQVQILSPQPNIATNHHKPLTFRGFCFFVVATQRLGRANGGLGSALLELQFFHQIIGIRKFIA